jgi:hypothetical protein
MMLASVAGADLILYVDDTTGAMSVMPDATVSNMNAMNIVSTGGNLSTVSSDSSPFPSATFTPAAAYYTDNSVATELVAGQVYSLDLATSDPVSATTDLTFTAENFFSPVATSIEVIPEPATMCLLGLGGAAALLRRRK